MSKLLSRLLTFMENQAVPSHRSALPFGGHGHAPRQRHQGRVGSVLTPLDKGIAPTQEPIITCPRTRPYTGVCAVGRKSMVARWQRDWWL